MAVYTDAFTGNDGDSLTTHDARWIVTGQTAQIWGNQARGVYVSGGVGVYRFNATFADAHYAKAKIVTVGASQECGVAVRSQVGAASCFFAFPYSDGNVYAGQCVGGVETDWGVAGTWTANDVIEIAIDASTSTTIYVKKNGSTIATYTGKDALSGGQAGLFLWDASSDCVFDDWEGGDAGGAPTPLTAALSDSLIYG